MKRMYLLVLPALLVCSCKKNPAFVTQNQRLAVVQFTPDPRRIPQSSTDGQVRIAQFSPDGKRIVTRSTDGNVRIWDVRTGQALSTEPPRYQSGTPDNMPIVGGDNFKVLQDQIDALEKRVRELETKASPTSR
jgi:WD40 repeat protein